MSEDYDIIEPSSAEQYLWPEATQSYVRDLEARIEELEGVVSGLIFDLENVLHHVKTLAAKKKRP